MIEFSRELHEIIKFNLDGEKYVVDMEEGLVIPVDEIIWDILDLCSSYGRDLKMDQVTKNLRSKYKHSRINESMIRLSRIAEMGLLFSPAKSEFEPINVPEGLKILVIADFLGQRAFIDSLNYCLLRSLANHAEVYLAIPEREVKREEDGEEFRSFGIKPIFYKVDRTYSPAKVVPHGCDGILILSTASAFEYFFMRFNSIPVLLRVYNETLVNDAVVNATLEKYFALRGYDALICDSSWISAFFSQIVPDVRCFYNIPCGVDIEFFRPMDKLESKRKLIQALGNEFLLEKPLIGIVPGLNPRDGKLLLQKLLATNPDLNWLVVDPILERYFKKTGDKRISFFSVLNLQDKEVSPLVFSALDLAIFPAILGSSGTLLLEMAACGIPLIVWGYSKPVEIGDFCLFIHVESSLFDRVTFPIESISENINFLLGNQNEREKLSEGARKLVSSYTWDVTSQQVLDLFRRFNLKRNLHLKDTSSDFPILFSKHYNTAQGKVESHAFEMPYFFQYDIEKGIALTLLGKHTLTEIRALLMHICREQERANQIIEEIAEDMILSDPNCF